MSSKAFLSLIYFSLRAYCFPVLASDKASTTYELTNLQRKIKRLSHSIDDLKLRKNSLLSELKKLDAQYGKNTALVRKLNSDVKQLQSSIKKNRRIIGQKKKQIGAQKRVLKKIIVAAHAMGKNEKLKVLLNQQDPSKSGRMMIYYDYFNQAKLTKIKQINTDLLTLHILEQQQTEEIDLVDKELQKKKQLRQRLSKTKLKQRAVLAKINTRFTSKKQQLVQFKQNEKTLKTLLLSLQDIVMEIPLREESPIKKQPSTQKRIPLKRVSRKAFARLKGKLPWPVKGKLIKNFGDKRSDSQWAGVLIKAKEGRDIKAIAHGRVVYADWLRGYGLLTIIDHGKGYMTLYAFNQSLYKSLGDNVDAGTIIASVGSSGGQAEAGLYFGVRKKGRSVNPIKWCRKVRHGNIK